MHTQISLVRHGVTEWNYEARAQGHSDVPLSAEGLRQAQIVAERLVQEHWDAIYSSPLSRAVQTAEATASRLRLPIQTDPRLMERELGPVVEGRTPLDRLRFGAIDFRQIPGVETDEQLRARVAAALCDIAQRHPGQRILCFSHGGSISNLLAANAPTSAQIRQQRNTAITRLRHDGETYTLDAPPDFSHLLVDGIEFSAERGRCVGRELALLFPNLLPAALEGAVLHATAIEAAWAGNELVAFSRLFSDGVLVGYVDMMAARQGYEHLLPALHDRLAARYPAVDLIKISNASPLFILKIKES